jgi:hypothetical protein
VNHGECLRQFGPHDDDDLDPRRDLRILQAYQNRLLLEPRDRDTLDAEALRRRIAMLQCCFPQALTYTVRAGHQWVVRGSNSGFRHDVHAVLEGEEYRCRRNTCDPRLRHHRSRAFEISQRANPAGGPVCPTIADGDDTQPGCIGPAEAEDYACTVAYDTDFVQPGAEGSACIFENLTARFAIYRGHKQPADDGQLPSSESERDMAFSWQTVGGYSVLAANIVEKTSSTSPRSMTFVPQLNQLAVVDGRLAGLTFISLSSLSVSRFFY